MNKTTDIAHQLLFIAGLSILHGHPARLLSRGAVFTARGRATSEKPRRSAPVVCDCRTQSLRRTRTNHRTPRAAAAVKPYARRNQVCAVGGRRDQPIY